MDKVIEKINSQNWMDWALEKIIFDDNTEDLKIILSNEYEKNIIFRCKNYIGFFNKSNQQKIINKLINMNK